MTSNWSSHGLGKILEADNGRSLFAFHNELPNSEVRRWAGGVREDARAKIKYPRRPASFEVSCAQLPLFFRPSHFPLVPFIDPFSLCLVAVVLQPTKY